MIYNKNYLAGDPYKNGRDRDGIRGFVQEQEDEKHEIKMCVQFDQSFKKLNPSFSVKRNHQQHIRSSDLILFYKDKEIYHIELERYKSRWDQTFPSYWSNISHLTRKLKKEKDFDRFIKLSPDLKYFYSYNKRWLLDCWENMSENGCYIGDARSPIKGPTNEEALKIKKELFQNGYQGSLKDNWDNLYNLIIKEVKEGY